MPKTLHETNYDMMKTNAHSMADMFRKNPVLDKGQLGIVSAVIKNMEKQVKLYTTNTPGTEKVRSMYQVAATELPKLTQLVNAPKADNAKITASGAKIAATMAFINNTQYCAPPPPPPPPPARPSVPPPPLQNAQHAAGHAGPATSGHGN